MSTKTERYEATLAELKDCLAQVRTVPGLDNTETVNIAIGLMICDRLDGLRSGMVDLDSAIGELPRR